MPGGQPTLSLWPWGVPTHRLALPSASVTPSCSHTQTHRPCSRIYNNATYNRSLSLSHEMYTVLRSVLALDRLAKVNVGFPSNSVGSWHARSFVISLRGGGWRGLLWEKQLRAQRPERKGSSGWDGFCSLPHQLEGTKPVAWLYSLLRLCSPDMQNYSSDDLVDWNCCLRV